MPHGLYSLQLYLAVRIPQIDHQCVAGIGVILHLTQGLYNGQTDRSLGVGGVLAQLEYIALLCHAFKFVSANSKHLKIILSFVRIRIIRMRRNSTSIEQEKTKIKCL